MFLPPLALPKETGHGFWKMMGSKPEMHKLDGIHQGLTASQHVRRITGRINRRKTDDHIHERLRRGSMGEDARDPPLARQAGLAQVPDFLLQEQVFPLAIRGQARLTWNP
jgi:hypothetical protein